MVAIADTRLPFDEEDARQSRNTAADTPGLSGPVELSVTDRGDRPMTTAWVSDRLLARTIDVWSRAYDRSITTQEAMEILMNTKRLGELLIRAQEERKA